jgi:hypothetical protein
MLARHPNVITLYSLEKKPLNKKKHIFSTIILSLSRIFSFSNLRKLKIDLSWSRGPPHPTKPQ